MQRRIGFDIGDVMCPDLPKRRNPDGTYRLVPAFPDCLEILTEVGQVVGPANLFVVSRAFDEVSIAANWDLLHSWDFFGRTGIPEANIHIFPDAQKDWSIKGRIAGSLALTDFVDDKRGILDLMPPSVRSLYLAVTAKTTADDLLPMVGRNFATYPSLEWRTLQQLLMRS